MSPLVYLLVWSSPPHIPYISSPNQCLLSATHAHAISTCFAVVQRLYHLFLVSQLITWDFIFYLNITHPSDHSHLCSLKCHLFSILIGQVSLPCSILLHTQLLYSLPLLINDISLYQLPDFISSNLDSGLHSCISISIHTQHITQVAELIY